MLNLRIWRLVNKLSQADAARWLRMSHLTYSYLERGSLAPSEHHLQKLREAFGRDAARALEPAESPVMEVAP